MLNDVEKKFEPFLKDAKNFDLKEMKSRLNDHGVYFFTYSNVEEVEHEFKKLGPLATHPNSEGSSATPLVATGGRTYGRGERGFSNCSLLPHTDQSLRDPPLAYLALLCVVPAIVGGSSLFVDAKLVYGKLKREFPHYLEQLSDPELFFHRFDDTFSAVPIFSVTQCGRTIVRARLDELGFASLAGSEALLKFKEIVDEYTVNIQLKPGDGFILNNSRWLHGRLDFHGERKFLRYLIAAKSRDDAHLGFESVADSPDKLDTASLHSGTQQ
jgi:alpha-ketoglutarate-dependent taurine dioxygenase